MRLYRLKEEFDRLYTNHGTMFINHVIFRRNIKINTFSSTNRLKPILVIIVIEV